ncbi:hypothetical protein SAMN06295987_11036 [Novosphingobium mathurense]|uniref:Uncharacterized protein n=1 Tax=Novosphingobium mathurense TaxID=428990 RepID=A0A1U6INX9_9SPHN|nr:hypothetical protein SAMN06295987_11036 [Novosphingobium mathurense]
MSSRTRVVTAQLTVLRAQHIEFVAQAHEPPARHEAGIQEQGLADEGEDAAQFAGVAGAIRGYPPPR